MYFDNYFYFAGAKSTPVEILAKYHARKFVYYVPLGKSKEERKIDKQLSQAIINTNRTKYTKMMEIFDRLNIERQPLPRYRSDMNPWFVSRE